VKSKENKICLTPAFNKAGIKRELLDTIKARKLAYYGHTMGKQGNCLEKEIMQGTMPGVRRRGRPRTAWIDNIKSWTRLSVEESIRMTEDTDKWRKYVPWCSQPSDRGRLRNRKQATKKLVKKREVSWKRHREVCAIYFKLECGPMPNLMVALPNTGGAFCSTPQSLADAHY